MKKRTGALAALALSACFAEAPVVVPIDHVAAIRACHDMCAPRSAGAYRCDEDKPDYLGNARIARTVTCRCEGETLPAPPPKP